MAIEIKELHIRVSVNMTDGASAARNPGAPSAAASAPGGDEAAKDALVAECVEQVLQILQSKMER